MQDDQLRPATGAGPDLSQPEQASTDHPSADHPATDQPQPLQPPADQLQPDQPQPLQPPAEQQRPEQPVPSDATPGEPGKETARQSGEAVTGQPAQAPWWQAAPAPETTHPTQAAPSDSRLAGEGQPSEISQQASGAAAPVNWWEQQAPGARTGLDLSGAQPVPQAAQAVDQATEEHEGTSFWRWLWEGAVLVVLAFVIAFVIKVFVVQPFYIPSGSMEPTLLPGDRVLVNKFIYRFRDAQPGDIVVFEAPRDAQGRDFIKRVIAVEGQTVEVKEDGKLYVNGRETKESYLAKQPDISTYGPLTLSNDQVFVMGDNRTNSSDSRVFGPFNRTRILGEAFVVYWPFTRLRTL